MRPGRSSALAVCGTCAAELKSAREQARPCPVDGSTLSKEIVLNVVIDHCPQCGGIWLDAGELRLLVDGGRFESFLDGLVENLGVS